MDDSRRTTDADAPDRRRWARTLAVVVVAVALVLPALATMPQTAAAQQTGYSDITVTLYNSSGGQVAQVGFNDTTDVWQHDGWAFSNDWGGTGGPRQTARWDNLTFTNGTMIESFEDGNIDEYDGEEANFGVHGTAATDGSWGLSGENDGSPSAITRTSELAGGPEHGTTFSYDTLVENSGDSQSRFWFGANSSGLSGNGSPNEGYRITLQVNNTVDDNGFIKIESLGGSGPSDSVEFGAQHGTAGIDDTEWARIEVEWGGQEDVTVDSLSIGLSDRFHRNESKTYNVTATMSDGSTQDVTGQASEQSNRTSVLQLDPTNATANANDSSGWVLVNATYEGLTTNETTIVYNTTLADYRFVTDQIAAGTIFADSGWLWLFLSTVLASVICVRVDEEIAMLTLPFFVAMGWLIGFLPIWTPVASVVVYLVVAFR